MAGKGRNRSIRDAKEPKEGETLTARTDEGVESTHVAPQCSSQPEQATHLERRQGAASSAGLQTHSLAWLGAATDGGDIGGEVGGRQRLPLLAPAPGPRLLGGAGLLLSTGVGPLQGLVPPQPQAAQRTGARATMAAGMGMRIAMGVGMEVGSVPAAGERVESGLGREQRGSTTAESAAAGEHQVTQSDIRQSSPATAAEKSASRTGKDAERSVGREDACRSCSGAAILKALGDVLAERLTPLYERIEALETQVAGFASDERKPKAAMAIEEKNACLAVYAAARNAVELQMADLPHVRGSPAAMARLESLLDGLYRNESEAVRGALLSVPPLLSRKELRKHVLKVMAERRRRGE